MAHHQNITTSVHPCSRAALEAKFGKVWNIDQLLVDFELVADRGVLTAVRRRSDGAKGSVDCLDEGYYFDFQEGGLMPVLKGKTGVIAALNRRCNHLSHNIVAHPIAGVLWFFGCGRLGDFVHEHF